MARNTRAGPLIAGLILILIGVGFLMENLFGYISFWHLFARYWPVIFILIGLSKLYSYFNWEEIPPVPGPEDPQHKE